MSESNKTKRSGFSSKEDAFEYLVQQSQNELLKEQWRKQLDQLPEAPKENIRLWKGFKALNRYTVGVAASLLLLIGAFYGLPWSSPSLDKMAMSFIEETNIVSTTELLTRGNQNNHKSLISQELQLEIENAIEQKDYSSAIGLFHMKEKESPLSTDEKFYYALSLAKIENGDTHKAIRLFESIRAEKGRFYFESVWLQGLLHLKTGETEKGEILLKSLLQESSYQSDKVQIALKRLKE